MAPPSATPSTPSHPQESSSNSRTAPAASQDESNASGGFVVEQSQQQTDSQQHPASQEAVPSSPDQSMSHDAESTQQQTSDAALTDQQHASSADAQGSNQQETQASVSVDEATPASSANAEASDQQQAQAEASSSDGIVTSDQQQPPKGDPAEKHESNAGAIDVLFDGEEITVLESRRVHTSNTHGTGGVMIHLTILCENVGRLLLRGFFYVKNVAELILLHHGSNLRQLEKTYRTYIYYEWSCQPTTSTSYAA